MTGALTGRPGLEQRVVPPARRFNPGGSGRAAEQRDELASFSRPNLQLDMRPELASMNIPTTFWQASASLPAIETVGAGASWE